MKVLVPVKRVIDYNVKARVKADQSGVDLANVKMSMNPFDEIAVEEATRLKEKGVVTEIIAVSVGPTQAQETLRTAMAIGADRGILVETTDEVQPLAVAKILKAVVDAEQPRLVIAGKQAIDNDMNATGQMLSALLGWSQATFASKLEIEGDAALVTPEVTAALAQATDVVGYIPYVARVAPRPGLTLHATDNRVELDRARHALDLAAARDEIGRRLACLRRTVGG
mgnify:CR=1 FL=1